MIAIYFFLALYVLGAKGADDGTEVSQATTSFDLCRKYYPHANILDSTKRDACEVSCRIKRVNRYHEYINKRAIIDDDNTDDGLPEFDFVPRPWLRQREITETRHVQLRKMEPCGSNKVCNKGQCVDIRKEHQHLCDTTHQGSIPVQALPLERNLCKVSCVTTLSNRAWISSEDIFLPYRHPCGISEVFASSLNQTEMGCYRGECIELSEFPPSL